MAKVNANAQVKKGGGFGKGKAIGLFLLIIAVVGAYLFYTYGSLPSAIVGAKQLNSSTLVSIMAMKINSSAIVNLSYSGSVVINNTDPLLSFFYIKNGTQTWSELAVREMPSVGDVEAKVYMNQSSGNGIGCIIYNFTAPNSTQQCTNSAYPYSVYTKVAGYLFDVNSISNVRTVSYGLQSIGGQPCYSVSGSGSVMINQRLFNKTGYAPANFTFNACLSAKYNVPLNVEVHAVQANRDSVSFDIQNYGMVWSG